MLLWRGRWTEPQPHQLQEQAPAPGLVRTSVRALGLARTSARVLVRASVLVCSAQEKRGQEVRWLGPRVERERSQPQEMRRGIRKWSFEFAFVNSQEAS
jgi:hypothetical protein